VTGNRTRDPWICSRSTGLFLSYFPSRLYVQIPQSPSCIVHTAYKSNTRDPKHPKRGPDDTKAIVDRSSHGMGPRVSAEEEIILQSALQASLHRNQIDTVIFIVGECILLRMYQIS
jgi:hypothetical protein